MVSHIFYWNVCLLTVIIFGSIDLIVCIIFYQKVKRMQNFYMKTIDKYVKDTELNNRSGLEDLWHNIKQDKNI